MDIAEFAERMQAAYDEHKRRKAGQPGEARAARTADRRAMGEEAFRRAHERRRAGQRQAAGPVRPALVLPAGHMLARLHNTRFW